MFLFMFLKDIQHYEFFKIIYKLWKLMSIKYNSQCITVPMIQQDYATA